MSQEPTSAPGHQRPREELLEKIARFPATPGIYLMKDPIGRIIYVGKAVNLRSRVRSYFQSASDSRVLCRFLVARVADVDCIVTESESEALILENNLIKKHRPQFNIRLKDDKTYVSIKVTIAEEWPRVLVVRRYKRDGNLYFGPYGSAGAVREMLRMIKTVFPLRTCSNAFFKGRARPCIEHEIGRCTAPCVGLVSREEYQRDVEEVILFLRGRNKQLLKALREKMEAAAAARRYELAARYRDQIRSVERVFESQKAQGWTLGDLDVFAFDRQGEVAVIEEVLVRDGRIVSSQFHSFRTLLEEEEVLASFLSQYYLTERYIPTEILVSRDFADRPLLESWLRDKRGVKVTISVPERGDKAKLLELASKNAANAFAIHQSREEQLRGVLHSLQEALGAASLPRRIECYDISNFHGSLAVGAMVTFEDGLPVKGRYRKFRIQTVVGADDFQCMREVLVRRLRHADEAGDLPDLMLIDGGKGQLGVALECLQAARAEGKVALASLAKERRRKRTAERVFVPGRAEPLPLPQESAASLYLQQIRDEAHRFAVSYHRELRRKATLGTGLEGIEGLGRKKRDLLLDHFRSLKAIREARLDSLEAVVGRALAKRVHEALRGRPEGTQSEGEPPAEGASRASDKPPSG